MTRTLLLGTLALAVAACGGSTAGEPSGPQLIASRVEVLQGEGQIDTVGHQLPVPIRIQVLDTAGAVGAAEGWQAVEGAPVPVPGQLVNFVVTSGGGSVFAGAAITDSIGRAQELWTLGPTAGTQCLEARAVDQGTGQPLTFAQVCATGIPGPMTAAGFTIDSARVFGDTTFLVPAFAHDAYNNPIQIPAITVLDSGVVLQPEGLSWRASFRHGGLTRLVLNADTLYLYTFSPRGWYHWTREHGDTTWDERGKLRFLSSPGADVFCPHGYTEPQNLARRLAADSMTLVRTIADTVVVVDTLTLNTSTDTSPKACSIIFTVTGPLRPSSDPELFSFWGLGNDESPNAWREFVAVGQPAPFAYVTGDGQGVDSLWLGQP